MSDADYLKLGDWNAICDRCGRKSKASTLVRTWDNLWVHTYCWDPRHPSDFFRVPPDNQNVPWTRPEGADAAGTDIEGNTTGFLGNTVSVGDVNKTLVVGTDPGTQDWNTTLTANRTITFSTSGVEEGDRFKIYRTAGGAFTLDIGGLQTGPASVQFAAEVEYNGSSWQLVSYIPLGL